MPMNLSSSSSWMSWSTRRWLQIAIAVAIASTNLLYLGEFTFSRMEEPRTTSPHESTFHSYYKHDFAYNSERFEESPPRIVILAGPHKAASSTIQKAISTLTAWTVRLEETRERKERIQRSKPLPPLKEYQPHPAIRRTNWVWPLPVPAEYFGLPYLGNAKFYAKLAGLLFVKDRPHRSEKLEDFRWLFSKAWEEGKNIVVGSERFDSLVSELSRKQSTSMAAGTTGEATYVAPSSSWMIDELLSVFPWDNATQTQTATAAIPTAGDSQPLLRLDDIEVQINYRTPRSDHIRSMWHTLSKDTDESLQQVLTSPDRLEYLFWTNSLAMALQLVRKNVKTTIIDMGGVKEKEFKEENLTTSSSPMSSNEDTASESVLAGIPGIVACDILRMGTHQNYRAGGLSSSAWCDDQSRLHVPNRNSWKKPLFANVNSKTDARPTNLTQNQMEEIERAYTQYDCGVWQHLQKYQAKGSLRILYPGEHLFETCNPRRGSNRDISFVELLESIRAIASGENG